MAPPVASAKLTLSCPLYASDFDPQDDHFLLVGGGGGEARTGVGNKIVLLVVSGSDQGLADRLLGTCQHFSKADHLNHCGH